FVGVKPVRGQQGIEENVQLLLLNAVKLGARKETKFCRHDRISGTDKETGKQGNKEMAFFSLSPCLPFSLSLFAFHIVTKNQVVGAHVKPAARDHGMGP